MRAIRLTMAVAIISTALCGGSPARAADTVSSPPAVPDSPQPTTAPPPTSAKPEATAPAAPAETTTPPSVTVIDAVDAHGILGRDVRSAANEDMGRLVDVIVDRGGSVRGAVIDFGGFLGVGSRKIVVDWSALHFWNVADKTKSISLELTRDQVKAAPEYKEDQPIVVLGASGSLEPLRFPPMPTEK
jgi:PRC-barrel domain protein